MFEKITVGLLQFLPEPIKSKFGDQIESKVRAIWGTGSEARSARAALTAFIIRVISAALAFVVQVFLARWMGSAEYGIFTLVWVTIMVLGIVSCLGFNTSIVRFVTEYREKRDWSKLSGVLIYTPIVAGISAIILGVVIYAILTTHPKLIASVYFVPFYIALFILPFLAMDEIQDGVARSFDMPALALAPPFIVRPTLLLVLMGGAWILGYQPTATTGLYCAVASCAMVSLFQAFILWRRVITIIKREIAEDTNIAVEPKTDWSYWTKVSIPVLLAGGFFHLLTNIDVLFVGYFLNPEDVATYFAVLKTLAFVHFVQFALRIASAHHYSSFWTRNDMEGLQIYASRTAQWTFWPALAIAGFMALTGHFILELFGEDFTRGSTLLVVLALGIVIRASIGPAESLLAMAGQQNAAVIVLAVTLVANIVLNFTLIPQFGLHGAAFATLASMSIETMALYVALQRKLKLNVHAFGPLLSGGTRR